MKTLICLFLILIVGCASDTTKPTEEIKPKKVYTALEDMNGDWDVTFSSLPYIATIIATPNSFSMNGTGLPTINKPDYYGATVMGSNTDKNKVEHDLVLTISTDGKSISGTIDQYIDSRLVYSYNVYGTRR